MSGNKTVPTLRATNWERATIKVPDASTMGTTISFHVSYGGGKKKHKEATEKLVQSEGVTNSKRVEVRVDLFDSPHLSNAKTMGQALRNYIGEKTLPWGDDGRRYLGNDLQPTVLMEAEKQKSAIIAEMEKHFSSYPKQKTLWEAEGGGLAKTGLEFPTEASGRAKFKIDIVPGVITNVDDVRAGGMPKEQRDRFIKDVRAAEHERLRGTVREVTKRVETVMARMVDRLGKYGKDKDGKVIGKFTDSLISNAVDIAGLLEHFNITKDPEVEAVRRKIVRDICPLDPETLRNSSEARASARRSASEILSRVGRFGSHRD